MRLLFIIIIILILIIYFKDAIIEEVSELLIEDLAIHSTSIAFPELSIPIRIFLKKFMKQNPLPQYRKKIQQILQLCDQNIKFIEDIRQTIQFSPSNITQEVQKQKNFSS